MTPMSPPCRRCRDESGQATLLIIGFAAVLLLLVGVVVDASAAYLHRSGLNRLADGAALAGAEALDVDRAYGTGLDAQPALVEQRARARVDDYLRSVAAPAQHPGLQVSVRVVGEDRVVVSVRAPVELPLRVPGNSSRPVIEATGSAVTLAR